MELAIATYNILNPYHAVAYGTRQGIDIAANGEALSNWSRRKRQVASNIIALDCPLILIQEATAATIEDVCPTGYSYSFKPHYSAHPERVHGNAVLFDNSRFDLLEEVHISTRAGKLRYASGGLLFDRTSRLQVLALSVHLKGYDGNARAFESLREISEPGLTELKTYVSEAAAYSRSDIQVLGGDFNEDTQMKFREISRTALMIDSGYLDDQAQESTEIDTGRKIDYIFCRFPHKLKIQSLIPMIPYPDASDHLPHASKIHTR